MAVRRLLAVGVDVGVTNPKGMTAKEIAKDRCAPPPLSSQQSFANSPTARADPRSLAAASSGRPR